MEVFFVILCIVLLVIFIYARYIEPYQLEIKRIKISDELGIKILHMSDLHFGKNFNIQQLKTLVDIINSEDHDILVFTGDFFDDKYKGDNTEIIKVLSKLECKNKYAIYGNHDYKHQALFLYKDLMHCSGLTLLENSNSYLKINDKSINVIGSDDFINGNPDVKLIKRLCKDEFNILLLHEPDCVEHFLNCDINLVLSGHSHGGQIRFFANFGVSNRLGRKYKEGLFNVNNKILYVSSGIGVSGIRLRFRVKPSISILSI